MSTTSNNNRYDNLGLNRKDFMGCNKNNNNNNKNNNNNNNNNNNSSNNECAIKVFD